MSAEQTVLGDIADVIEAAASWVSGPREVLLVNTATLLRGLADGSVHAEEYVAQQAAAHDAALAASEQAASEPAEPPAEEHSLLPPAVATATPP